MIYPVFKNINELFVQSFKTEENNPTRSSFVKYYMALVEIKDLNALIDSKPFFDQRIKNLLKCQEIMITQQKTY